MDQGDKAEQACNDRKPDDGASVDKGVHGYPRRFRAPARRIARIDGRVLPGAVVPGQKNELAIQLFSRSRVYNTTDEHRWKAENPGPAYAGKDLGKHRGSKYLDSQQGFCYSIPA
jgi:hypothetical protein